MLLTFYEKFLRFCEKTKKAPTAVVIEAGLKNSAANAWKNGSVPRDSTLLKLANYFGCELDDLKSDAPDSADPTSLTTFQRELLLATQGMTPAEQEQLLRYAKFAVAEREKDKAN